MDEYISFMKKYNANPSDLQLLAEYAKYVENYTKAMEEFNEWDGKDMTDEELVYYAQVQTRVSQKLSAIS